MHINDILHGDTPSGDILSDGLPKILPPYENGVFQAVLTLPEAHDALVGIVAAILGQPVKTVLLRNNDAPTRDKTASSTRRTETSSRSRCRHRRWRATTRRTNTGT